MHNHNNCLCEHKFRYCAVCDTVYCKRCKREWRSRAVTWTTAYPSSISVTTSNDGYDIESSGDSIYNHLCEAMNE